MSQGEAEQELLGEQTRVVGPARDAAALLSQAGPVGGGGQEKGEPERSCLPMHLWPFCSFSFHVPALMLY